MASHLVGKVSENVITKKQNYFLYLDSFLFVERSFSLKLLHVVFLKRCALTSDINVEQCKHIQNRSDLVLNYVTDNLRIEISIS